MEKDPHNLIRPLQAPVDLSEKICNCIEILEKRSLRRTFFFSTFLGLLSLILLFWAGRSLYYDLNQSGLFYSFQLIFRDSSTVLSYWEDFSSMMVESLPITSLVSFLFALLALIFSLGYFSRYRHYYYRQKLFLNTNVFTL